MNRPALALSAALVVSIALTAMYARNAQRERARANAFASRLSEREPLEKGGDGVSANSNPSTVRDPQIPPALEASAEAANEIDTPTPSKPITAYRGTRRTLQLVDRLQSALATGTPLQAYQIQPLIDAIDEASKEAQPREAQEDANRRIVQAALPVLFESQLDRLIALEAGELEHVN